jgi:threonylcarbamoyladenosine tRNA methylthiotransferase MtaB
MLPLTLKKIASTSANKTFLAVNFGCRANAAETNQLSQILLNSNLIPSKTNPGIIIVNTCSVTKKGDMESRSKINKLATRFPNSIILATGCARLEKLPNLSNIKIITNPQKAKILHHLKSFYSSSSPDTMTRHHRFQLKVQSGCTAFCSYCIVPYKRPTLWSLPVDDAINTVNRALSQSFTKIIITGINLAQYQYGLFNLVKALLTQTSAPLISFGSIPLLCVDDKFTHLFSTFHSRLSNFLHVPIQSGSNKILKLMNRPYTQKDILETFNKLKSTKINNLKFGTDIIVGFPKETDDDFNQTYNLCQFISFTKIHTFRFSPRPGTEGQELFDRYPKIPKSVTHSRSRLIRSLISQTTPPSHQIGDKKTTPPALEILLSYPK